MRENDMSTPIHRALHYVKCYNLQQPHSGAKQSVNELVALLDGPHDPIAMINELANIVIEASGGYVSSNDLDYANDCLDYIVKFLD